MSNNLKSQVLVLGNDEVKKMVDDRIVKAEELAKDNTFDNGNGVHAFSAAFYDKVETSEDGKSVMFDWSYKYMGAKWNYLYDVQDYGQFSMESATYPPIEFFIHLFKLCHKIDPKVVIEVIYEDEGYSPVGAIVLKSWGEENVNYSIMQKEEEILDPTIEMDWEDEGYESAGTNFRESIYEKQQEFLSYCHEWISDGDDIFSPLPLGKY
jgi:hypothetical protein